MKSERLYLEVLEVTAEVEVEVEVEGRPGGIKNKIGGDPQVQLLFVVENPVWLGRLARRAGRAGKEGRGYLNTKGLPLGTFW